MTTTQSDTAAPIEIGTRVRDAVVARLYGKTELGTVVAVKRATTPHANTTDWYAEVRWDSDLDGDPELLDADDVEVFDDSDAC